MAISYVTRAVSGAVSESPSERFNNEFPGRDDSLTLHYDFAKQPDLRALNGLGPTLSLTRTTTKTVYDQEGIIRTVRAGEAAFMGARRVENLAFRSEEFDNGTWLKENAGSVTANSIANPLDGALTGDTLIHDGTASPTVRISQGMSGVTATGEVTVSVYAKEGTIVKWLQIDIANAGVDADCWFDLENGALGATPGSDNTTQRIEDVGDGWYRCSLSYTPDGTDTSPRPYLYATVADNSNGISAQNSTSFIYIYGFQVEDVSGQLDSSPSEYQATTTAAVSTVYATDKAGASITPTGISIEEARTNIAIYSSDVSNAAWVVSNVTKGATSVTTPDGTPNTTVRLTASAANGTCLQTVTSAIDSYVYSVYMKRVTGTGNIDLTVDNGVTWTTQTLTSSWTRFYVSDASETNPVFGVRIVVDTDAIDFWGSEVNKDRTWPTSYIPTVAGSVLRNKDLVSTTDVSWLNESASTFYFEAYQPYDTGLYSNLFDLSDGTTNNRAMSRRESNSSHKSIVNSGGVQTVGLTATSIWADDTTVRGALAISANDAEQYVDGTRTGTGDQSVTMPVSPTQFELGAENTGSVWNGCITEIRVYNVRKDNQFLEALTNGNIDV